MLTVFVALIIFSFQFNCISCECPIAGCQPNRCYCTNDFTSVQKDPQIQHLQTPLKLSSRGCVASGNNIVCPLDPEVAVKAKVGCLALDNAAAVNKSQWWRCKSIDSSISLPIIDVGGNVIASDGYTLTAYTSNGGVVPKPIKLFPNTGRLVDLVYTNNNLFEMIYKCGLIFASDTNGIPWASTWINNTAKSNGTFVPLATPAVRGERMYLLTGFWPTNASASDNSNSIIIRLFAIDSTTFAVKRLQIAWQYEVKLQGHLPAIEQNYKSCIYRPPSNKVGNLDENTDNIAQVMVIGYNIVSTLNYKTSSNSIAHLVINLNDTGTSFNENCVNTVSNEAVVSLGSYTAKRSKHSAIFIKAVQKQESSTQLQIFNTEQACKGPIRSIDLSEALANGTSKVTMTSKLMLIETSDTPPLMYIMCGALSASQEGYAVALQVDKDLKASVVWKFITPDKMPPVGQIATLEKTVIYSTKNSILLYDNN